MEKVKNNLDDDDSMLRGLYIYDDDKHFFFDVDIYAHNNKAYNDMYLLMEIYMEKNPHVPI